MDQEELKYFTNVLSRSEEIIKNISDRFKYESNYIMWQIRYTATEAICGEILPEHAKERVSDLEEMINKLKGLK